eukprot:GHVN01044966.1.p1 GENE.GHVN01044966.1~~GHVN01044966.1.p1  ORF type:complete len:398 (-),score=56.70 GHVN01044966.1:282-1475(-)
MLPYHSLTSPNMMNRTTRMWMSSSTKLKETPLAALHKKLGGRMVPFCGWNMPLNYKESTNQAHKHCREKASLFDVSHMGQLKISGKNRVAFIERWVCGDIEGLKPGQSRLTLLTTDNGGILDDTIVTKQDDYLSMVVNAGCFDKDFAHLTACVKADKATGMDVQVEHLGDRGLLALQGPTAMLALQKHISTDLTKMPFMSVWVGEVAGVPGCTVTRCGYTGEDGVEISIPNEGVETVAVKLLATEGVMPCGLGARDSLRLEAGLCLYGHDMDEDTTPVEASLLWTIPKHRRTPTAFNGAQRICKQIELGAPRKRVGLVVTGGIAREGADIIDPDIAASVGRVTSGTMGPSINKAIAMAYVDWRFAKVGTALSVNINGKIKNAEVVKMPFVPNKFYRG